MAFIDPFELLQLEVGRGQTIGPEELRRAKRKLLAEFELSDGITIPYRGKPLDKAAALAALEQLEDPVLQAQLLNLHQQPSLLRVIRDHDYRTLIGLPPPGKLGDAAFCKYFSSLLAPEFNEILGAQLRKSDWSLAGRILNRLDLIDSWDNNVALKSMVQHARMSMHRIQEAHADTEGLKHWNDPTVFDSGYLAALNRLPDEFQHLRNQYGVGLEKLAIALTEAHERHQIAHLVITAAARLKLDPNTADRIQRNQLWIWSLLRKSAPNGTGQSGTASGQAQTEPKAEKKTEKSGISGCSGGIVVLLVILALRLIFSFSKDGASKDYTQFDLPKPYVPGTSSYDKLLEQHRANTVDLVDTSLKSATANPAKITPLDRARYDTILFRDLIFYETLNAGRDQGLGGEILNPENGANLYSAAIPPLSALHTKNKTQHPLLLANESAHECVFFFETLAGGQISASYYLRPHSEFLIKDLPATFHYIRAYHGLDLRKNAASYRKVNVPAFSVAASRLNNKYDSQEVDQPLVEMVLNFAMHDFNTKEPIIKKIVFNKEYWLKEKKD